jgi:T4 RnlA family RNA ligase
MDLKMTNAADYVKESAAADFTDVIDALNAIGTDGLTERYGIKVSQNENYPNLYVLNYHQIDSAKFKDHPVVVQCRSLVVEYVDLEWRIASRAFDRFFNYGEMANDEYENINELIAYEKVDGSLVSVFNYNGEWLYRTKSMLMPAAEMQMTSGRSWKELIESTINRDCLTNTDATYIFEVVSRDNRVVTRYDGDQAYLLAMRNNKSGRYACYKSLARVAAISLKDILIPHIYKFKTMEDCLKSSTELPNLEEGYVMYNKFDVPVMKIKSPAYVAAHRLRGESVLTPKRILEMYRIGEDAEYLAIFPEDAEAFGEVAIRFEGMIDDLSSLWYDKFQYIQDQKEYALEVMKDCKQYQGFMFQKKKNRDMSFVEMSDKLPINKLVELLGY